MALSCFHCGQPVPQGTDFVLSILGEPRQLCCPGCQTVAQTIVQAGLEDYYQHRSQQALPELLRPQLLDADQRQELLLFDEPSLQAEFVHLDQDGRKHVTLIVEGISCAACIWLLEQSLQQLPGMQMASLNLTTHRASLSWDAEQLPLSRILNLFYQLGYKAYPYQPDEAEALQQREQRTALIRIGVAFIGMMQVMMYAGSLWAGADTGIDPAHQDYLRLVSLILTTPVVFYSCIPFFKASWRDLRTRHLTMDVPVSIAIIIAYLGGIYATYTGTGEVYFESITMFAFLLLLGRYLEMRARHRMGQAGNRLQSLLPTGATLLIKGEEKLVPARQLQSGDLIRVKPGHALPADGIIRRGCSSLDESVITGESLPVMRKPGDSVIGGSLNVESPLDIEVSQSGQASRVSAITRLLERAQSEKPKVAVLADKVASHFVLAVLIVSALVSFSWYWIRPEDAFWITLSVLVVTCPCALSLATPTALTAATGTLRQLGLLITRGHVLEALSKTDYVVFDKTGTLTSGQLQLVETQTLGPLDANLCQDIAARLEQGSEHPIAQAFDGFSQGQAEHIRNHIGQGVEGIITGQHYRLGRPDFACPVNPPAPPAAQGQWLLLADEQQPLAWFRLQDSLRPEAAQLISQLQQQGLQVALLSGDAEANVAYVAKQLHIQHWQAGALPEDKLTFIEKLQQLGHTVTMIGDGINDIPVLAKAQVSVAMNQATDLAKNSADAMLLRPDLLLLAKALTLSKKTRRIIAENLAWSLGYNLLALPLAAMGWIPPSLAALGMATSSLLVVGNAMRLARL